MQRTCWSHIGRRKDGVCTDRTFVHGIRLAFGIWYMHVYWWHVTDGHICITWLTRNPASAADKLAARRARRILRKAHHTS